MLQLTELNRRASAALSFPPASGFNLEGAADGAIAQLREKRSELAQHDWWSRWCVNLDRLIYSDDVEYLDRPDFPDQDKLALIQRLHRFNRALLSYHRFLLYLRPHILRLAKKNGRPVRALELASGSGELALELSRLATKRGLPVEVTGSDIVPTYVRDANLRARKRGLDTEFIELNAFDMAHLDGRYDLIFITQSIHHFTPGQLAMMIAQSEAAGASDFIGIDGRRGFFLLSVLPVASLAMRDRYFWHDATLSARRMYSNPELELIANIAAPEASVRFRHAVPGFTVLSIGY